MGYFLIYLLLYLSDFLEIMYYFIKTCSIIEFKSQIIKHHQFLLEEHYKICIWFTLVLSNILEGYIKYHS